MTLVFNKKELTLIKKLNNPVKIQKFLNSMPFNFEEDGQERLKSPIKSLRTKNIHCFEGALLGAFLLSQHGQKPLIMYFKTKKDFDHVIALFKINNLWGALSKTNHNVLRYRDPVYKSIRELAMSYFHEYFLNNGKKTLRAYSAPLNLNSLKIDWIFSAEDLWEIDLLLNKIKHYKVIKSKNLSFLKKVDKVEIQASQIEEYKKPKLKKNDK